MPRLKLNNPVAYLGVGVLLFAPCAAQAQSVFEALFGAPRVYRPAPVYNAPPPSFERLPPAEVQPERRRRAPALAVSPPPVMPKKAKPARVLPDKEIVASLMRDSTLQRGDIVIFPDGPKVYRGRGGAPHRASDFEDARTSRLIGKDTRKTVLAGTQTIDSTITAAADAKPRRSKRSAETVDVVATGGISVSPKRR